MEFYLSRLGLGEDQISKQNQTDVRKSLILLNRCIENPDFLFKCSPPGCKAPTAEFGTNVLNLLLDRKKLALLRYDTLINKEKFEEIRRLIGKIADKKIRASIEKNLFQLAIKDQILKKEYRKIDKIRNPHR